MPRLKPSDRVPEILAAAVLCVKSGMVPSAPAVASLAGCHPTLVRHYLYPVGRFRKRLVAEAVRLKDAQMLSQMLSWPESHDAPAALRRAAARELLK